MSKFYLFFLAATCLCSCGVSLNYLGNTYSQTAHVDVYVEQSAIRRPYTVIGKGYERRLMAVDYNIERLQEKAVQKAKEKGADAVLFQDYYLLQPGTNISTTTRTDTLNKAVVTTGSTQVTPTVATGRQILFLKYE